MGVEIEIVGNKDFLEIILRGTFDRPSLEGFVDGLKDAQEKYDATRIFVDATRVSGEIVELDRFWIGKYASEVLSRRVKFAFLVEDERIDKFFENVAVNRGLSVIVVGNRRAALDWLLKED